MSISQKKGHVSQHLPHLHMKLRAITVTALIQPTKKSVPRGAFLFSLPYLAPPQTVPPNNNRLRLKQPTDCIPFN